MPSVYDFRHVETDKIGQGKRVLAPPGGQATDIFSATQQTGPIATVNGVSKKLEELSVTDSAEISIPSTPTNGQNGANGHGYCSDSSASGSAPSSANSSRRGSRQEDTIEKTKNRLFGAPDVLASPRRVVDRMRSNIFAEPASGARNASPKKYAVRRNPITGEVLDAVDGKMNGHNGVNGKSNGISTSNNGSISLPTTPVRVRQPPGGKSSGIF